MRKIKYSLFLLFSFLFFFSLLDSDISAGSDRNFSSCSTPYHSSGFYNTTPSFYSYLTYERWVPPLYRNVYDTNEEGKLVVVDTVLVRDGYHTPDTMTCGYNLVTLSDDRYGSGVVKYSATADGKTGYGTVYWDIKVDTYISYNGSSYGYGSSNGTTSGSSELSAVRSNRSKVVTSHSDVNMPSQHCVVTRGDGSTAGCSVSKLEDRQVSSKLRLMCFYFVSGNTNDGDSTCYERAYPLELSWVKTHDKVYPGFEYDFVCRVKMGDGLTRTLDSTAGNFLNHVYFMKPLTIKDSPRKPRGIFIGNYNLKYPYIYPDKYFKFDDPVPAKFLNHFLSYDSYTRDYTVTCGYYASREYIKDFWDDNSYINRVSDTNGMFTDHQHSKKYSKEISISHNVKNIGLSKLEMSVDGYFPEYDKDNASFKMTKDNLKSTTSNFSPNGGLTTKAFDKPNKIFLAGHRYNFKLTATFTDNKTADVTANPFVYWNSSPHYKEGPLEQFETNSAGFPFNGSGFRYPFNLKSYVSNYSGAPKKQYVYIAAEFIHENALGNPAEGKTRLRMGTQTREIIDFKIKEFKSANDFKDIPRSSNNLIADLKITPSTVKHKYVAIVNYSDGTVENWTNTENLKWNRDFNSKNTLHRDYDFTDARSDSRRLTVFAEFYNKGNPSYTDFLTTKFYRGSDNSSNLGSVTTRSQTQQSKTVSFYESLFDEVSLELSNCNSLVYIALECKDKNPDNYELVIVAITNNKPTLNDRLNTLYQTHPYDLTFTFPSNAVSKDFKTYKDAEDSLPLSGPYQGKIKVDNRNIFYDVRQFPVSGTSGSTGDN